MPLLPCSLSRWPLPGTLAFVGRPLLPIVLLVVALLSACAWKGRRRVEKPVLEPVGPHRSVVVRDEHGSETLLGLPHGALNSVMWPTRVTAAAACFAFQLRLWEGAGSRSMRPEAWSFWIEVDDREPASPLRGEYPWTHRRGPYGWEAAGELCFPAEGVRAANAVSVHAVHEGPLELVFGWEDRL